MMSFGSPQWRKWVLDSDAGRPLVRSAVESGVTFFDTADSYSMGSSEVVTGALLRECFASRDDYVLATKVFYSMGEGWDRPPGRNDIGLSRKHILSAVDASLRRLGTEYIDLYQIHRYDPHTPIEETMQALHDVVRSGKARYIGASSMYAWQFANAQHVAERNGWTRFVNMQDHYNLLYREEEREMHPLCVHLGVGVTPWSPLARGRLAKLPQERATTRSGSDPFYDSYADGDELILDAVVDIAKARGLSPAQVSLAWMLNKSAVTAPIIGATKPGQIEDAVAAIEVTLSTEEITALEAPYVPRPVLGHD